MSYPKYFVSYCVMGKDADSNMMGHACLILSIQTEKNARVEVVDAMGFYSQKGAQIDSWFNRIKNKLGFQFDISDVFGRWASEEIRFLDRGGLKSANFLISREKFLNLKAKLGQVIQGETEVVEEITALLSQENIKANGTTIFHKETELHPSSPRLNPFKFDAHVDKKGVSTVRSSNCKTQALSLLELSGIDKAKLQRLRHSRAGFGIPRLAHGINPMKLFATGELHPHRRKNGAYAFSRKFTHKTSPTLRAPEALSTETNRLYWLIPPQFVLTSDGAMASEVSYHQFGVENDFYQYALQTIRRLQRVEYALIKRPSKPLLEHHHQQINQQLQKHYVKLADCLSHSDFNQVKFESMIRLMDNYATQLEAYRLVHECDVLVEITKQSLTLGISSALLIGLSIALASVATTITGMILPVMGFAIAGISLIHGVQRLMTMAQQYREALPFIGTLKAEIDDKEQSASLILGG